MSATAANTGPEAPATTSNSIPLPEYSLSAPPETDHRTLDAIDRYLEEFCPSKGYMLRSCDTPGEDTSVRHYECVCAGKPAKPVKHATVECQCQFSMIATFNPNTSTWRLVPGHLSHTHPFEHFLPAPPLISLRTREEMDEYVQSLAPSYGYTIRVGRSWNNTKPKCIYECSCSGKAPEAAKRKSILCDCVFNITTLYNSTTKFWTLVHDHLGHTHPPDYTVKRRKKRKHDDEVVQTDDPSRALVPAPSKEIQVCIQLYNNRIGWLTVVCLLNSRPPL